MHSLYEKHDRHWQFAQLKTEKNKHFILFIGLVEDLTGFINTEM